MNHIDYFKLQAKNFLKDFKTRYFDESEKRYCYRPKYFDIDGIFLWLGYNDNDDDFSFTLMNAQHVISQMVGFEKWNDLIKANPSELELAHLVFDSCYRKYDRGKSPFGIEYEIQKLSFEKGFGAPCYHPRLQRRNDYGLEISEYKFIGTGKNSNHAKFAVMQFVYGFLCDERIQKLISAIPLLNDEKRLYGCFGKIRLVKKFESSHFYTGEARFWSDEKKAEVQKEFNEMIGR